MWGGGFCDYWLERQFANWLINEDKPLEWSSPIGKDEAMIIAVSCIGLYFIIAAIPTLLLQLCSLALLDKHRSYEQVRITATMMLLGPIVQIALGAWLFAGSKGILKFWKRGS